MRARRVVQPGEGQVRLERPAGVADAAALGEGRLQQVPGLRAFAEPGQAVGEQPHRDGLDEPVPGAPGGGEPGPVDRDALGAPTVRRRNTVAAQASRHTCPSRPAAAACSIVACRTGSSAVNHAIASAGPPIGGTGDADPASGNSPARHGSSRPAARIAAAR